MTDVERIEAAFLSADPGNELYDTAKAMIGGGMSRDKVAERIASVRERFEGQGRWSDRLEDHFVDVIDALYGWCHPSVRLGEPL
jgi:hypothetical protein